jgi:hypothetical protein
VSNERPVTWYHTRNSRAAHIAAECAVFVGNLDSKRPVAAGSREIEMADKVCVVRHAADRRARPVHGAQCFVVYSVNIRER